MVHSVHNGYMQKHDIVHAHAVCMAIQMLAYQEHCVYSHYQGLKVCFHRMILLAWRGYQRGP